MLEILVMKMDIETCNNCMLIATVKGDICTTRYLLHRGANNYRQCLEIAALLGHKEIVLLLIKHVQGSSLTDKMYPGVVAISGEDGHTYFLSRRCNL